MRCLSLFCCTFILTLVMSTGAVAGPKETITVPLINGKYLSIDIFDYKNDRGQREFRFETHDISKVLLGYGRDIDGDGEIENFFIFGENGITRYDRNLQKFNSHDRARIILSQHARHSGGDYFTGIATNILTFLSFAVDRVYEAQKTFYKDWMDLEELYMALNANRGLLTKEEMRYGLKLYSEGTQLSYERFARALDRDYFALWGADAALWISGAVMLKWAGTAVKGITKSIAPKIAVGSAAAALGIRLSLKTYQVSVRNAIKALTVKSAIKGTKNIIVKGAKNILAEWKYIALSTGVQIGVETYVNYDEINDPDPKKVASNLMGHSTIQENVAIGVTDSVLMTGASALAKNRLARFALLGMIGASSSLGAGVVLSGDQAKERVALDAVWATGIDPVSLMIELNVLHRFQALAIKNKNPRLKLVGYAIVLVTQAAGYYAYSRAANWVDPAEDFKDGEVKLIPITLASAN